MKVILKIVVTILICSNTLIGQNIKNFIDQPYIEVTGQVETEITPNEIYLSIVLNENDRKGKVSIEKQENTMIEKLKFCDIDIEKQLSIEDFDGFYKRKFLSSNEFSKIKRYQLLIYDGETLGKIYQALDEIDISNISIIKLSHSNLDNLKRENKLKALKKTKEKAIDYAKAINQSLGNAIYIQEVQFNNIQAYNTNTLQEVKVTGYGYNIDNPEIISNLKIKPIVLKSAFISRYVLK